MNGISRRDFLRVMAASALLPIVSRIPTGEAADGSPNILIIVADALSARHMSLYGYDLDNTPNFKRWADRAAVFHNHYAGGSFTTPGTASLLTGTYPWTHRAFALKGAPVDDVVDLGIFRQFSDAGYHTLGFTQNVNAATVIQKLGEDGAIGTNVGLNRWHLHSSPLPQQFLRLPDNDFQVKSLANDSLTGLRNGSLFARFLSYLWQTGQTNRAWQDEKVAYPLGIPHIVSLSTSFRFNDVIDGITSTLFDLPEPFMGYVHLFPPHAPYRPTQSAYDTFFGKQVAIPQRPQTPFDQSLSNEKLLRSQNLYDTFIADVDTEFGRMMEMLEAQGKLDNTWVIFTSDHGEMFSNQYAGHTTQLLADDLVRVPLLIFTPETTERQDVYDVTSCVDLIPTLLNAVGRPIDERYPGVPLPGFGGGRDQGGERFVFASESQRLNRHAPLTRTTSLTMRHGRYKLERYIGYEGVDAFHRLFDLENDPLELNDISDSQKGVAADLLHLMNTTVKPYQ